MFNIFKRNKFNSKQEKNKLINYIEIIRESVLQEKLYKVDVKLEEIINKLDNPLLELNLEKVQLINDCLNKIKQNIN